MTVPVHSRETRDLAVSLPEPSRTGTVARRKMIRAVAGWAVLWAVALVVVITNASAPVTAAALGLVLPGGGLLATGHWALGLAGLAVFVLSVIIWWAAGPVVLPPLVCFGLAVLPLALDLETPNGWVLSIPPALIGIALLTQELRFRRQVARGRRVRADLAKQTFTVTGAPAEPPVAESSEEDLAALRYALDLALQPIDEFAGFTKIDQFREAALRYQLNSLGYALSTSQFTRTPAFTGYLAEAQRNAITKMLDKRVWGYWAIENLWGNLRWNPDPADRENIMLTGFLGLQVGMYETLNDDRFSQPGALTFRWNGQREFSNSFTTLAESVHRNMLASDWTLYPCEPNWTYTICNTFGLNTLITHDRLHGTHFADDVVDRLRAAYDTEFLRPDGRIIGVRCERLGLSWNMWASPAVQLGTAFWLHAGLPDIAQRTWWILGDQEIQESIGLAAALASRLDPGNYRLGSDAWGLSQISLAAREMGDARTATAAFARLEERGDPVTENGVRRYAAMSGLGNLYALQSRFNRSGGMRDLVTFGAPKHWREGPILAEAAYPDVLVAKAVTDGTGLELVLRPGNGPVRTTLRLERLVPFREYRVKGARTETVQADARGEAFLEIDLGGRLEVGVTQP